jgi:hypothetical protein
MYSVSVDELSVISTPRPLDRTAAHGQPTEALVSAHGLFSFVKVRITGLLSASVLFLCLSIGLGWRTTV